MKKLMDIFSELKLDVLIITDGYNMHYLSGYKGHTGCMLIFKDKQYILTDSRYTEQVELEAPDYSCVDVNLDGYSKTVSGLIASYFDGCGYCGNGLINIGFENNHISYKQYKAFNDEFKENLGDRFKMVELNDLVSQLRMVKSDKELCNIARAEAIGDETFKHIISFIKHGMTEQEVALELEYTMRKLGATGLSFDTIAASGPNSSLPHAVPTERVLRDGDFLTMDFGCVYNGYCSDMTRTVFIGDTPGEKQKRVYDIVLRAQTEAMKLIKPGIKCSDVDACARKIIADEGYGDYFGHGLGHSVGLYIHEEPRCSRKCDTILEEGMTMTVEPGIYLPGEFGVRIEDLVVVTKEGYNNLTASDKGLICI